MKILVVDDDFADGIAQMLRTGGHTVVTADDRDVAQKLYNKDGPFDLVLTDLLHPGLDGVGLIQAIGQKNPKQKVGILTGFPVLCKPFTKDGLLHFVESLTGADV
ncbi:MAG TPA: response regulator [Terriglobales bacterium]|nr:response regulator [Terriglobales bacterium]